MKMAENKDLVDLITEAIDDEICNFDGRINADNFSKQCAQSILKIINGLDSADQVSFEKRSDVTLGYLPQEGIVLGDRSILKEVEAAANDIKILQEHLQKIEKDLESLPHDSEEYPECLERFSHINNQLADLEAHKLRSKAEKILFGLGFTQEDLSRPCKEFSGGWQMRIALARLLLEEPDLLMMDEPTNHLDLDSLRWLEGFLEQVRIYMLKLSKVKLITYRNCGWKNIKRKLMN